MAVVAVALLALVSAIAGHQLSSDGARASAGTTPSRSTAAVTSRPSAASPVASPTTDAAVRQQVSAALDACRLANLRQQAALGAAAVSMAMWAKHVEAMNLLVAGKISLAVAMDFWDSSRVGAMKAVNAFWTADLTYTSGPSSACAPLGPAVASAAEAGQVHGLDSCASSLPHGDATLALARTAVTTWQHHIHDMEAMRDGRITPAHATALWQKNWRAGNTQLKRYDAAVDATGSATCPLR